MQEFVLDQVAKGGYCSVSDYIGELVRGERAQASLEAEVIKGLRSGESTAKTSDDWIALRKRAR